VLGREYGYYLRKLHAKAQDYDTIAERATDEQSSAIHLCDCEVPGFKEVQEGSHVTILSGRGHIVVLKKKAVPGRRGG
jgi:hypothetical protein